MVGKTFNAGGGTAPTATEKLIILRATSIFGGLPNKVLSQVADLLDYVEFKAGQRILQQNDPGDCMYIISQGKVRVHQGDQFLNYLTAGNVFGEMALLDSEPRIASVTAEVDTRLYRLAQSALYDLMAQHPQVSRGIIQVLSRHLRGRIHDLNQAREEIERLKNGEAASAPDQLGPYQLMEQVGKGGMGEVYRGIQPALERTVAIKILAPMLAMNPEFRQRFEREARMVANLTHPNIVTIYDYGKHGGTYYIVMEFIDGITLEQYLKQNKPLPLAEVVRIVSDLASGLDHAHALSLVHRDVKPENVMMRKSARGTTSLSPRVVLMDFGLSKELNGNIGSTQSKVLGTAHYMAPEQIMSPESVDHRVDIYSLGVLTYRLLTGTYLFDHPSHLEIMLAHYQKPPTDPSRLRPEIPADMASVVLKALEKEPTYRYASAGAFAADLQETMPSPDVEVL